MMGRSLSRVVAEAVAGVASSFRPDLVLYDAGVDPHAGDSLGRLCLTDSGLFRRDLMVGKTNMHSNHARWTAGRGVVDATAT